MCISEITPKQQRLCIQSGTSSSPSFVKMQASLIFKGGRIIRLAGCVYIWSVTILGSLGAHCHVELIRSAGHVYTGGILDSHSAHCHAECKWSSASQMGSPHFFMLLLKNGLCSVCYAYEATFDDK